MDVSGSFDIPAAKADNPAAAPEAQEGGPERAREIARIAIDAPLSQWTASIRDLYLEEREAHLYREQTFLFLLGYLVALATVALNQIVHPEMAEEGLAWRLLIITPITLTGMYAAHRRWTRLMAVCLGLCPIAFVGIVVHLAHYLPPTFGASYLTATGIVLGLANIIMPYSRPGLVLFNAAFIGTVAIAIAIMPSVDFLAKTHFLLILVIVAAATLPIANRLEGLRQRSFLLNLKAHTSAKQLRNANRELRILSESDPLTGVMNRRGFENLFDREVSSASNDPERLEGSGSLALIMIDIDHFKHFNDTHGHQSGDTCLSMVANHLESVFVELSGAFCRYGGEEFIGGFAEQYPGHALEVGEQVRQIIASLLVPVGPYYSVKGRSLVTASIGIGLGTAIATDMTREDAARLREDLIEMADAALYSAKGAGRNRVEMVSIAAPPALSA